MSVMLIKMLHLFYAFQIIVNWKNSQIIKTNVLFLLLIAVDICLGAGGKKKKVLHLTRMVEKSVENERKVLMNLLKTSGQEVHMGYKFARVFAVHIS